MLCMVVREELKIPVTRTCLKHSPPQLSSLQYYRNTLSTKPVHESGIKPAPASTGLPDSNYYQVTSHKTKTFVTIWGLFLFIFCYCVALKSCSNECWSTSTLKWTNCVQNNNSEDIKTFYACSQLFVFFPFPSQPQVLMKNAFRYDKYCGSFSSSRLVPGFTLL